jgi:phenylpyruvate tautomerase PptA (4-oxalocrotonate tautomerase family)
MSQSPQGVPIDRRLVVGALAGLPLAAGLAPNVADAAGPARGVPVLVKVSSPLGVLDLAKRRALVRGITDVLVKVQGLPASARPDLTVLVTDTTDGGWGVAGHAYVLAEFPELVTKGARVHPDTPR